MDVVIIGAGGFGREILDVLDADPDLSPEGKEPTRFLGFLDDGSPDLDRLGALGERLLGDTATLAQLRAAYLIGVGSPRARRTLDARALGHGREPLPRAVHRTAAIGRRDSLGAGSVICAHAAITTNVRAGRHLHLNLGATIGHDCVVGDFVTIAPGANVSGNVTLGDEVEIGTGAAILPGLTVGDGAFVGAGAVVTKDVAAGVTVVGVPAVDVRSPRR